MFRLKPKDEPQKLPFPQARRKQRLAERQKRVALLVNRSLDRASGFSWSADRQPERLPLPRALLGLPAHVKVAAAASVVSSLVLVGAFLSASRAGLPTMPPIIWVKESAPPPGPGTDGARYRDISALSMRIAQVEATGAPDATELARLREDLMFERAMAEARAPR